jgi:CDP-diacylglycerol---serine O-phosphatidyltransferase
MAARAARRYIGGMMFAPLDPERAEARRARLRAIPVRVLVPNLITLLALCAGLTGLRLAIEGQIEYALYAIVFAAALDGIDGRVARMIKGTSRFGAELDSLADFVNFGVVPALILYFWGLHQLKAAGWIAAMVFAICAGLRLARFNVAIDDPSKPAWSAKFFTGMPAPAGAITVLLPIYVHLLGIPRVGFPVALTLIYTLAIAFLMVSRLPVLSGKKLGKRVPPDLVLPVFILVVLFVALLISYPWIVLTVGTVLYLASLPFGLREYRRLVQADAAAAASAAPGGHPGAAPHSPSPISPPAAPAADPDRPARLN